MLKKISILTIFFFGILGVEYFTAIQASEETREQAPVLEIESVIAKAKSYSQEKGTNLDEYFIKNVNFDWSERKWAVLFSGRVPMPGNHFMIWIHDQTKEIEFMPGL